MQYGFSSISLAFCPHLGLKAHTWHRRKSCVARAVLLNALSCSEGRGMPALIPSRVTWCVGLICCLLGEIAFGQFTTTLSDQQGSPEAKS